MTLIRHDTSVYNILRDKKKEDSLYKEFLSSWEKNDDPEKTKTLALRVQEKFALSIGDANTPLAGTEGRQAFQTGTWLAILGEILDVIFVSPYKRALLTLEHIIRGWPALESVKTYKDDRI